jgi:hypothetical protein
MSGDVGRVYAKSLHVFTDDESLSELRIIQTHRDHKRAMEEERRRAAAAEEERRRAAAADAERKRLFLIEESHRIRRRAEEAEAVRRRAEEAEAVRRRAEEEEAVRRRAEEEEAVRRRAEEAEAVRRRAEEEEAVRRRAEEAEMIERTKQRRAEDDARRLSASMAPRAEAARSLGDTRSDLSKAEIKSDSGFGNSRVKNILEDRFIGPTEAASAASAAPSVFAEDYRLPSLTLREYLNFVDPEVSRRKFESKGYVDNDTFLHVISLFKVSLKSHINKCIGAPRGEDGAFQRANTLVDGLINSTSILRFIKDNAIDTSLISMKECVSLYRSNVVFGADFSSSIELMAIFIQRIGDIFSKLNCNKSFDSMLETLLGSVGELFESRVMLDGTEFEASFVKDRVSQMALMMMLSFKHDFDSWYDWMFNTVVVLATVSILSTHRHDWSSLIHLPVQYLSRIELYSAVLLKHISNHSH